MSVDRYRMTIDESYSKEATVSSKTTTAGAYNYDEAVELTGHGRYNYLQLAACCVIMHAVALDIFGFGMVLAAAACDLKLGVSETALLASMPFASILFSFPWGYFCDQYGRKRALQLSSSVGFLFATLSAFSPNWQTMMALKFIDCSFTWASYNLYSTYIGECTVSAKRTRYIFIVIAADLGAEFVFYSLAYFILPLEFAYPIPFMGITLRPWRVYQMVLATPLGIGAMLLLKLEESPKFLASKGKEQKALKVLEKMFVSNGGNKGEYPVKSITTENVEDPAKSFWSTLRRGPVQLFKPPLLWRTLQLVWLIAIVTSTNFVWVMWYPAMTNILFKSLAEGRSDDTKSFCQRLVSMSNETFSVHGDHGAAGADCKSTLSMNTIYSGIILSLIFVSINLIASTIAKYRRLVLMASLTVSAVSLVLVELVPNAIASVVAFTLVQCSAVGLGSVGSYFVELYPTGLRGLANSFGVMVGQVVTLGGVNLIGAVIFDYCSVTFYGWAVYVCSGIILTLFLPSDFEAVSSSKL